MDSSAVAIRNRVEPTIEIHPPPTTLTLRKMNPNSARERNPMRGRLSIIVSLDVSARSIRHIGARLRGLLGLMKHSVSFSYVER